MKCRVWRTGVVPGREADYEQFARVASLPMFRAQAGFRGVLMARDGGQSVVVTLWEGQAALDQLEASALYKQTVKNLLASGILEGAPSVDIYDAHLLALDGLPRSDA
jgi:heme-degrading monooxygenase HmoA